MAEYWINNKGKILVGQNGTVPAAENKNAVIVDYAEWHKLDMTTSVTGAPAESANSATQDIPFSASIETDLQSPVASWNYSFSVTVVEGIPVTISSSSVSGGITGTLTFPVGVTEGQKSVINILSAGLSKTIVVTVTA